MDKKFLKGLGLTKTFMFRGKKYKWTCKWWQLILTMFGVIGMLYVFVINMFMLEVIING